MIKTLPKVTVQNKHTPLGGGVDLVTPPLSMGKGFCSYSKNVYQDINHGYTTFQGCERYSGLTAPSSAQYSILAVNITGNVTVGDILTDDATTSYGTVILISDSFVVLTKIVGNFSTGNIRVSTIIVGTCTGQQTPGGAASSLLDATYKGLAADEYRSDIEKVGGASCSGSVLGKHYYNGVHYAFRNNAAGTATTMWKAAATGWVEIDLGYELEFTSGGSYEPQEGDEIEGEISGATAKLTRIAVDSDVNVWAGTYRLNFTAGSLEIESGQTIVGSTSGASAEVFSVVLATGTWAEGTAAGYVTFFSETGTFATDNIMVDGFKVAETTGGTSIVSGQSAAGKFIFASKSGVFQAETVKVGLNANVATIAGDATEITFAVPSGRFECINANFTGLAANERMYGVDGKNRGFEFDGSVFVPIETGMITDTPTHLFAHKYQLFFSYDGSAQHSAPGRPYQWSIVVGGNEIGVGDTITGFINATGSEAGAALAILTRNSIGILYGNNIDDWNLIEYKNEAGAIEWSPQVIGNVFILDDRGIVKLATSQAYGNFADATESKLVQPWITSRRGTLTASCVSRDNNQYWLFFESGDALCCTVDDGNIIACMPMSFPCPVSCASSSEDADGNEIIMLGCTDGYVRQMYKGTSFDGDEIEWTITLAIESYGAPLTKKRFRQAMLEVYGEGYAEFLFSYDLEYNSVQVAQHFDINTALDLSTSSWDDGTWDVGTWDNMSLTPSYFHMMGSGLNVAFKLQSSSAIFSPLKFSGVITQFNFTREKR